MTAVVPFDFAGQQLRVDADEHGEPSFVAADVAAILGYRMASDMTRALDEDERGTRPVRTPSGAQEMTVLTEAGLYAAIFQRQTGRIEDPAARETVARFKRWVTHEVLPAIRRTGSYSTPVVQFAIPQNLSEALRLAADEHDARVAAETKVAELAPAAEAWNALAAATGDFSLRDAAQMLNRDPRIDTGQNRLMKTLEAFGMVDTRGRPYQRHAAHLRRMPVTYEHPNTHEPVLTSQIRVTADGLRYLHKRITGSSSGLAVSA